MDVIDDRGNVLASFDDPGEGSPGCGGKAPGVTEIPLEIHVGDAPVRKNGASVRAHVPSEAAPGDSGAISVNLPIGEIVPTGKAAPVETQARSSSFGYHVTYERPSHYECGETGYTRYNIQFWMNIPEDKFVRSVKFTYTDIYCATDDHGKEVVAYSTHSDTSYCIFTPGDMVRHSVFGLYDSGSIPEVSLGDRTPAYTVHFHLIGAMNRIVDIRVWNTSVAHPEGGTCHDCHVEGYGVKWIEFDGRRFVFCGISSGPQDASAGLSMDGSSLGFWWNGSCDYNSDQEVYVLIGFAYEEIHVGNGRAVGDHPACAVGGGPYVDDLFIAGSTVTLYHDQCWKHSRGHWALNWYEGCHGMPHIVQGSFSARGFCKDFTPNVLSLRWECVSAYHVLIYYVMPNGEYQKKVDKYTYSSRFTFTASGGGCRYEFDHWKTSAGRTVRGRTVTLRLSKGEMQAYAYYNLKEYALGVMLDPPGSGSFQLSSEGPYHYGDKVTITVEAADCYLILTGESGDMSAETRVEETVTFKCEDILKAYHLIMKRFDVNVSVSGGCDCSVDEDGTDENGTVECGGSVTLTAVPGKCSRFVCWSTGETDVTITIDDIHEEKDVTAYFDICRNTTGNSLVGDAGGLVTCGGSPVYGQRTC